MWKFAEAGCLEPAACGAEHGPCCGSGQQIAVGTGDHPVVGNTLAEHAFHHRDYGVFQRHLLQLTGAASGFRKIVADAQRDSAEGSIAVSE
jgi:hypothetical protein